MPHTSRNFLFAYAFLVIFPIVGLAGILKSGHGLAAPPSIDGLWDLQVDSAQLDSLPCGKTLSATVDKAILISQSGRSFTLSSPSRPDVAGSGTLDGGMLRGSFIASPESSSGNKCAGRQLTLLANVDRNAGAKSLAGTLSVADCPTCPKVAFRAERQPDRQPPTASKEGH